MYALIYIQYTCHCLKVFLVYCQNILCIAKNYKDTKWTVIYKILHIKLTIEQLKTEGALRCYVRVTSSCSTYVTRRVTLQYQGRIQRGAHPARAPPKIGENMIFWHKIVIFHTKYPKHFRASLRNWNFFYFLA